MKEDSSVPVPVLRRMPSYLAFVKTLQKRGEKYVSSTRIAEYMDIDSTQVTKDLSHTGLTGKTRVGYEVDSFVRVLEDFLGFSKVDNAFLVGAGSLGSALLQDKGLAAFGLNIEAAFDVDDAKVGTKVNDIEIYHIDEFRAMAAERNVVIGIITVPAEHAQNVADLMVAWGIKAIWNFTPARIKVPSHIVVQNTTIYMNLAILFNKLYNQG
ncbi:MULTISPECIES: redox-sensing transcriptional repressor Rex [Culturomica]|jgi:redox-sensing transcriptional repressor|uniref:redox-sensing transcriptional repressor Rex n=1 Tax=Culturomica TaxID=1926651 RepID=UPI0003404D8B|nr:MULTISPECIES: redox-sensing transcriptional repressor Rex [Odoribacteraceae]RHV91639.1 redox-sensing transcriptional repressor Rex [Odoribacter sp. OF09-27XD]CCZ09417.1 redox-sensing transcriptional repressor rex [Odoribacter sp. CAG:788]HBO26327.1 redox-sensing transcriptional repressor Rex [Culturomica sp.]